MPDRCRAPCSASSPNGPPPSVSCSPSSTMAPRWRSSHPSPVDVRGSPVWLRRVNANAQRTCTPTGHTGRTTVPFRRGGRAPTVGPSISDSLIYGGGQFMGRILFLLDRDERGQGLAEY